MECSMNGIGHHPIEPIAQTVPEAADGEFESVPPLLVGVDPVVSAVAGVVRDHGPAGEGEGGEGREGKDRDLMETQEFYNTPWGDY